MAARIAIAHDDLAAQRAIVEQLRAEPYTGARAVLPRIRRPRPLPLPPTGHLFASLPEMRRPPRPWEQPAVVEAAPAPAPWALTPEELAEVEALVVGRYKGDADTRASCKRWDAWIADGRSPENEILQLPGVSASGYVDVLETRLGWAAKVSYATTKKSLVHGRPIRPDFDDGGLFFWATREAAVQYSAYRAWASAQDYRWRADRVRRSWENFAAQMQGFLKRCGIDATQPPAPGLKRVLISSGRERELRLAVEAEAKAAKAAVVVKPDDSVPGDNRLGRYLFEIGAIHPPSPLALKRRRLRDERAAAARVAAEAEARSPKRGPSPEDVAYVQAAILDILPKGWPSYAKEILRVRQVPARTEHGFVHYRRFAIATLRLFDGHLAQLKLYGEPGAHGYSWHLLRKDKRPFHFDEKAWAWVRVDEAA